MVKITSGFLILIRQHYALIDNLMGGGGGGGTQKVTVPHTSPTPRLGGRGQSA